MAEKWPVSLVDLRTASSRVEMLRRDKEHFEMLATKLELLAGIHLPTTPKNLSLMAARVGRILVRRELADYAQYIALLDRNDPQINQEFISIMTTNTTEFFRESRHFEFLNKILPKIMKEKEARGVSELRIWCAASSSGQEVYSIVMTLLEADPSLIDHRLKVLSTDIDRQILEVASQGIYSETEILSVPALYRQKYFTRLDRKKKEGYMINQNVRSIVTFAPFNLMTDPYPFRNGFDIIFCRNVLIYFERSVCVQVTNRLASVLNPGGYLFVGHSEVGIVRPEVFASEASAVYKKVRK